MTDAERNLMTRTAVVVAHIANDGSVPVDVMAQFTKALHDMTEELKANNEPIHLLQPVLGETKK